MTLNSSMVSLMDKVRILTGLTDKISIDRLTDLMNHFDLHINPNLLSKTTYVDNNIINNHRNSYEYLQVTNDGTLENGKTYTLSLDAKTDDDKRHALRFRLQEWAGNTNWPVNDDYLFYSNEHTIITFMVPNDGKVYDLLLYNSDKDTTPNWITTFSNCKLEIGDLATPLEKVGGGRLNSVLFLLLLPKMGVIA